MTRTAYNRLLLGVAGLGGLLYGIDVGIVAGALPYLEATSGLDARRLSFVVAAVLLGSVFSTLFAGVLADGMGRRKLMALSGFFFVASIPVIALSHGYGPLILGRLLQGLSAGLVGVVVPLYLAECLGASSRGRGVSLFQWMLTLGGVVAALIGWYFSGRVEAVARLGDPARLFAFKDTAWRSIFWVSLPPGILFIAGSLLVAESPRWLFRRGRAEEALAALLRSRDPAQAELELREMAETAVQEREKAHLGERARESLLRRKYVVPFLIACVILACNQLTGINSIIGYNATILIQAGLDDRQAHLGYFGLTVVHFLATIAAVVLVDRKGRKFLLTVGTLGIVVSLLCAGVLFLRNERHRVDRREAVQALVAPDQSLTLPFGPAAARGLLAGTPVEGRPVSLVVIYSYGGFRAATAAARSDDPAAKPLSISRAAAVPSNRVLAFFANPFADLAAARVAPLRIENALVTPVPAPREGWRVLAALLGFIAFYSMGPGVCVWLALSELMPTRIRSNGMSVALLINQAVATTLAAIFLPTVGRYGYGPLFLTLAGFTVIYFIASAFFLPETKGRTLEEIEEYFEGGHRRRA